MDLLIKKTNFIPRIACYASNDQSLKANLAMGKGIILADSMTKLEDSNIKKFILTDNNSDCNYVIVVWDSSRESQALKIFLEKLEQDIV